MESTAAALRLAPEPSAAALLDELCEVPGALGALLVSSEGELLLERLPSELAQRAVDAARPIGSYCLRFFEQRLHVLSLEGAYLCVLSDIWTPSTVLKMAMNVTGRRLQ
jgi:hypothetical protein